MISINRYLDGILEDFQAYLDEDHRLCDLKSLNYDQGQVPDYRDLHIQQYYLLRYAYGYAFEYKCMFLSLLGQRAFEDAVSVTSIGCGAALDYWALACALEQQDKDNVSIRYTGIDLIRWNYRFRSRDHDRVSFHTKDAVRMLAKKERLASDIYIFPKSISEFPDSAFDGLCHIFQTTPIKQDILHLLVSVRADENTQQQDLQRIKQLRAAIEENGFRLDEPNSDIYDAQNPEEKIRLADRAFKHPGAVVDCLKELNVRCTGYQASQAHCQPDCEERLTRWPILSQGQVYYAILTFKRDQP